MGFPPRSATVSAAVNATVTATENATVLTPADPAAPPPAEDAPLSFEATAEDGVIRVPPEWRAKLGSTCRVRVTVPAAEPAPAEPAPAEPAPAEPAPAEPAPAAEPAAGSPPFPEPYPPPELVAAHPDWEWATPERLSELMPDLSAVGPGMDVGVWEGTIVGELMRNPPNAAADFMTREERNTDPHRNWQAIAMLEQTTGPAGRRPVDPEPTDG